MKPPSFPLYTNNWLASENILSMTPAEEGAYIHLLCIAWNSEDCGLPDDDVALAHLSRLSVEKWKAGSGKRIRKCFISESGRLFNERLLSCRIEADEWREKCRKAGLASAKARLNKRSTNVKGLVQLPCNSESESDSESDSESVKTVICSSNEEQIHPEFSKIRGKRFEEAWSRYPIRAGKKNALRHFKASVKNEADYQRLLKAMDNYLASERVTQGFIKDGSTFFNQWQDWENYVPPGQEVNRDKDS